MASAELKFPAQYLLRWFNKKIKSKNLEIDLHTKTKYEITQPIDWVKDTCCICKFLYE